MTLFVTMSGSEPILSTYQNMVIPISCTHVINRLQQQKPRKVGGEKRMSGWLQARKCHAYSQASAYPSFHRAPSRRGGYPPLISHRPRASALG